MLGRRFNRRRSPIGLDLGAHSLKMVQFQQGGDGSVTVTAQHRPLPAGEDERRDQLVVEAVHEMLASGAFAGRRVVSCLPAAALDYKNLRLPPMPRQDLHAAVAWEAGDRFNFNPDTMQLQFLNAGQVRQSDEVRQEIILLCASLDLIEAHVALLQRCDLTPLAVEAAPSALARCASRLEAVDDPNAPATAMLDLGHLASKVVMVKAGQVRFFKLIGIGGSHLDQAVADHLDLSLEEAAALRQRLLTKPEPAQGTEPPLFGAGPRDDVAQAVLDAQRPLVAELAREVGLCLRYYSVTFRGQRPERLWLVGGGSRQTHVTQLLAQGVDVELEPAGAPSSWRGGAWDRLGLWATAAGLAWRPTGTQRQRGAA